MLQKKQKTKVVCFFMLLFDWLPLLQAVVQSARPLMPAADFITYQTPKGSDLVPAQGKHTHT